MILDFESINIQGFKTFQKQRIHFAEEPGLCLLRSKNHDEPGLDPNGAGKSSIWDALFWCLYGRTVRGLKNPDVKPWTIQQPTIVSTKFYRDKKPIVISRRLNPNRIMINDREVGQEQIDKLVPGFELAAQTILLGQARPLFFDLAPSIKMSLLSDACDLESWLYRSRMANEEVGKLTGKLFEREAGLKSLDDYSNDLADMLSKAKKQSAAWDQEDHQSTERIRVEIKKDKTILEKIINEHTKYDLIYDGACVELRQLQIDIQEFSKQVLTFAANANRQELNNQTLDDLLAQRDEAKIAKTCPTCGQKVTTKNLEKHLGEIRAKIKKLENIDDGIDWERERKKAEKKLDTLRKAHKEFQDKANTAKDACDSLHQRRASIEARIKEETKVLDQSKKVENPHTKQINDLRKRTLDNNNAIADCERSISRLKKTLSMAKFWVGGFKDIRLYIIEEILDELEMVTNSILPQIGLYQWQVFYDIEKETKSGTIKRGLDVWIKSPTNKNPVKWESWSGGEGQRLKIAGALALSDVLLNHMGIRTNLEILDEPSQFMAPKGVRSLIEFLETRAQEQKKQIWLIDHQAIESSYFDSVLTVEKKNGVSTIR